ncbi:MAG: hypothetical protein WAP20_08745, partial [Limnochordia bacterium]
GEIFAVSQKPAEEIIYYLPDGARRSKMVAFTQAKCEVKFTYLGTGGEDGQYKAYEITINAKDLDKVHDLFLQIDYQGDRAEIYHEERLIADWFTTGDLWHVALRRFGFPRKLELRVYPTVESVYHDLPVEHGWSLKRINIISCAKAKVLP